jgi:hypothetical protein
MWNRRGSSSADTEDDDGAAADEPTNQDDDVDDDDVLNSIKLNPTCSAAQPPATVAFFRGPQQGVTRACRFHFRSY